MARLLNEKRMLFRRTYEHLVNLLDFISYAEMLSLHKKGSRNGTIRRLPSLQKGLFCAALEYARTMGNIVNQRLIGMIRSVAEKFCVGLGRRIFNRGIERAKEMLLNTKMRVFFKLRKWIDCDSYIFWLGTDLLVRQRSWVAFYR
jgi:hypothetical protein